MVLLFPAQWELHHSGLSEGLEQVRAHPPIAAAVLQHPLGSHPQQACAERV